MNNSERGKPISGLDKKFDFSRLPQRLLTLKINYDHFLTNTNTLGKDG